MKAIKLLAMVVVLATFASCGIFKNKSKQKHKLEIVEGVKIEKKVEESSSSLTKVKEREIDKGTVVTERTTTATTTTVGNKGKVVIKKGDLKPGENYLRDSAGPLVKAILDTLNKTLTLEIDQPSTTTQSVTNEKIYENKDVSKEKEEEKQESANKQVALTVDSTRREIQQDSSSQSTPSTKGMLWFWIGLGVFVLMVVIIGAWWFFGIGRRK